MPPRPPRAKLCTLATFATALIFGAHCNAQSVTAPSFGSKPDDIAAWEGDRVQFWPSVAGTEPISFQWLKDGVAIPANDRITSTDSRVLGISGLTPEDAGQYALRATNAAGTATSEAASLRVKYIRIEAQPTDQTVSLGAEARFEARVSASAPATFQWYKDGNAIPGATDSTFSIASARQIDHGVYRLSVQADGGQKASSFAQLTVAAPPEIVTQPRDTSNVVGQQVIIYAKAVGQGPIGYQWEKDGVPLTGENGSNLVINNAQRSASGSYRVVASNPSGSVTSEPAVATVFSILVSPPPEKVYDGKPSVATATTDPSGLPVSINYSVYAGGTWRPLEGTGVVDSGFYRAHASVRQRPYVGTVSAEFRIRPVPLKVSFGNLLQTYDGNPHPIIATTEPAGVPITLEYGGPNAPAPIAAGSYTVTAYTRDYNYVPEKAQQAQLVISRAALSLSVAPPPADAKPGVPFPLQAFSTVGPESVKFSLLSGNATISGREITVRDENEVTVQASHPGTINYLPATTTVSFRLGKRSQQITFAELPDRRTTAEAQTLRATADSGLPVALAVVSGPATLDGSVLRLTGEAGVVVVRATQPGNGTFNAAQPVDRTFTVTVSAPPVIVSHPRDLNVYPSAWVKFFVSATGEGPLHYQWLRNGKPSSPADSPLNDFTAPDQPGKTEISVVVRNGDAVTTSRVAILMVVVPPNPFAVPPVIYSVTANQSVPAGTRWFSLDVQYSGTEQCFFRWYKDGVLLSSTARTLSIPIFQKADEGFYTVEVENAAGVAVSKPIHLTLDSGLTTGSPRIIRQPASRLVVGTAAASVQFYAEATGSPTLRYQWSKDGRALSGATQDRFSINSATTADSGEYAVTVSNELGSITSDSATLTFRSPIKFTSMPESTTATEGSRVQLSATVEGTPPFAFQWWKDGEVLPGANSATLTLENVTPAQAGRYRVEVANASLGSGGTIHSYPDAILTVVSQRQPVVRANSASPHSGGTIDLAVSNPNGNASYAWLRNGISLAGVGGPSLFLTNAQSQSAGLYAATITLSSQQIVGTPIVVGLTTTEKLVGSAKEVGSNISHPNGNIYDQMLLHGAAATITSDRGQVTRLSFVDLTNDIVQVEFSGSGSLTLLLENASAPEPAASYNQPGVNYVKGHPSIVIVGADETTNLSIFSVGRVTAVNQSLFQPTVSYDGIADLGYVAISSTNGKFGGIRAGNAEFFAIRGYTGVYAPDIRFEGPLIIGNISGHETALAVLVTGAAPDARITGGNLYQENGRPVSVSGLTQLRFVAGTDSHGRHLAPQKNRAALVEAGIDVTRRIAVDP